MNTWKVNNTKTKIRDFNLIKTRLDKLLKPLRFELKSLISITVTKSSSKALQVVEPIWLQCFPMFQRTERGNKNKIKTPKVTRFGAKLTWVEAT